MTHTQTQGADGAGTKTAATAWLLKRLKAARSDSEAHPEGHSNRTFYAGQAIAYENVLSLLEDEESTPAPAATPGVPDSLRALSEAATAGPFSVSGVRKRYVENSCVIVDAPTCSGLFAFATADGRETLTALADAKFFVAAANHVRDAIAVHVSASEQAADDRREIEQLEHQLDVAKQERDAAFDRADAATRSAGTEAGWVVANAKEGAEQRFRRWGQIGPEWTADRTAALWFARRSDAEAFAAEDEDAWRVLPVTALAAQPAGQACVPDSVRALSEKIKSATLYARKGGFTRSTLFLTDEESNCILAALITTHPAAQNAATGAGPCEDDITSAMIQAGRYAANLNDGTLARIYLAMRTVEWEEARAGDKHSETALAASPIAELKPCPWEEPHLCCYPDCSCAKDREPAPDSACTGHGEAIEKMEDQRAFCLMKAAEEQADETEVSPEHYAGQALAWKDAIRMLRNAPDSTRTGGEGTEDAPGLLDQVSPEQAEAFERTARDLTNLYAPDGPPALHQGILAALLRVHLAALRKATTPATSSSVRKTLHQARSFITAYDGIDHPVVREIDVILAAQPAGQAGDAGERVAEIVNRWHDWIISASADMDQPEWSSGNRQTMEDDRNYLLSLLPGRQTAPNSTRTGAAETCAWAGGNDTCYCRTCGEEYRYGREDKPPCPRKPSPNSTRTGPAETDGIEAIAEILWRSDYPAEDDVSWANWLAYVEDHQYPISLTKDIEACRRRARAIITAFPSLAARPEAPSDAGWIKVEDQLPGEQGQDSDDVIVFLNGHCDPLDMECRKGGAWGHRIGWFDAERQCFRVHGRPDASVTHWMPKPPPPSDPAPSGQAEG